MRTTLIFLLLSLATLCQAQFPIRQNDIDLTKMLSGPLFNTARSTGAIYVSRPQVTSATAANMSVTIEPGKNYEMRGVQVTCDRPYWIGVTVRKQGTSSFNNQSETTYFTLGEKTTDFFMPYNEVLYEGGSVAVTGIPMSGSNSQDQGNLSMRLVGRTRGLYEVDNPDYRIVVLGDSKALYTLPTGDFGERYYPNQLARYIQSQGKKVSIIDKTMPGASSPDMVRMIKSGALEGIKYDLMVVAYGTNDAGTASNATIITQFKANLSEAIYHRNRTNPNASIVFSTPGVTDKSSLTPNIDAYRTAVSDLANDATLGGTSRKVYLCQEHLAFTVSTSTKSDRFIPTEALNSQLHYSMLGHDDVYNNRFLPAVRTTDFWLNVLKLP